LSFRLESPIHAPKILVLGFYHKIYGHIIQTPKRHILAWFYVFWAVACKNPSTGVWPVREPEKKRYKYKIIFCCISPILPEALSGCICTKFGIGGPLVDVINCADFFVDQFRGIDFVVWGLKFAYSPSNWRSPLTLSELPFRLWYGDWYTDRWWVVCYIWYSEEGPGRAAALPSSLIAVPYVTAHPSTAIVPTSYYLMWHYNCLWILKGNRN